MTVTCSKNMNIHEVIILIAVIPLLFCFFLWRVNNYKLNGIFKLNNIAGLLICCALVAVLTYLLKTYFNIHNSLAVKLLVIGILLPFGLLLRFSGILKK